MSGLCRYNIGYADVVELVDTHALGACASRREGSSPFIRTRNKDERLLVFFVYVKTNYEPSVYFAQGKM